MSFSNIERLPEQIGQHYVDHKEFDYIKKCSYSEADEIYVEIGKCKDTWRLYRKYDHEEIKWHQERKFL